MMLSKDPKQRYYARRHLHHPAWLVTRLAGRQIEAAAARYFHGSLLDIGCGDKWKNDLIERFVDRYVGVDHAGTVHDRSVIDRIGTAYALPATDNEFDCILCTAVLEHLEEPQAALVEAFRVLKPGGYALYSVPLFWHLHKEPRDFFRFTRYGIEHLFGKAGFELVENRALSGFWATFRSEFNYYLNSFKWGFFRPFISLCTALNNLIFLALEKLHRNEKWTWMYLVIARKPERPAYPDPVSR